MASVAEKLLTAEEFAQLPNPADGSKQELVHGAVVTMPPPKGKHGACCSKVDRRLGNFVEANKLGRVFANDTGFVTERGPDTVRGPDIAFWSYARLPEIPDEYIAIPPELAVEVMSPGKQGQTRQKVREYFTRGVNMVWVVDPMDRTVTVYRSPEEGRLYHESAMLSGEDVLPGFQCRVAELFD